VLPCSGLIPLLPNTAAVEIICLRNNFEAKREPLAYNIKKNEENSVVMWENIVLN
jgi:hypothetical protein